MNILRITCKKLTEIVEKKLLALHLQAWYYI